MIKIPKRFYIDHIERDLPAPKILRETKSHYFIDGQDTTAFQELVSDAEFYAEPNIDGYPHLVVAARAMLKAIQRAA
jgi:hypothetical protein